MKDRKVFDIELFFKENYSKLCSYAVGYVKEKGIAEDIVSETFYVIWKKKAKLLEVKNLKAYFFKSVHNNCLYYLRDDKNTLSVSDLDFELLETCASPSKDAEDTLILKELDEELNKAIADLPPKQRQVFSLKYLEDKRNKDVAVELGLSIKTIEMHLSLALKTLRKNIYLISGHTRDGP